MQNLTKSLPDEKPLFLERWLPWACFTGFSLLWALDVLQWHPGWSYLDESFSIATIQQTREGRALPFLYFNGSWHRALEFFSTFLFGAKAAAVQGVGLASLGLECLLLYALGKSWLNERAGLWAVIANLICAVTFVRARAILSYTVLPCELLGMLWLLGRSRSFWMGLLWGCLAALLLLDYEGWLICLPILGLAWLSLDSQRRPKLWALAVGFAAGLLIDRALAEPSLRAHWAQRASMLSAQPLALAQQILLGLKRVFFPGAARGAMAVAGHPFFPPWLLPSLLSGSVLALKKEWRWILGWGLLGLVPLALQGTDLEANRLMAAWPAACLLCGLGFSAWPKLVKPGSSLAPVLLLSLPLLGAAWESSAYMLAMRDAYLHYNLESAACRSGLAEARNSGSQRLISELGGAPAAPWRFAWDGLGGGSQGNALAIIPWDLAVHTDPSWGTWRVYFAGPERPPLYTLQPTPKIAARLDSIQASLLALRQRLPYNDYFGRRDGLIAALQTGELKDPWARTAALEEALTLSLIVKDMPEALVKDVDQEKLMSATPCMQLAEWFKDKDPQRSHAYAQKAYQMDERRTDAKEWMKAIR